jgi:RNA polymerase sigma-70 factor (ECF subfamily)
MTNGNLTVEKLVGAHRDFVAFVERRVGSRAVAEDIVQAAFVRGIEHGESVNEEKAVAWFYRVLRNAIVDHYRRQASSARALESLALEPEPTPEVKAEVCACVTGLLDELKPEYRDALRIVDMEDGALADLASQGGITAENAAVRVHRARKALRKKVVEACGTCCTHGCFDCTCG